MSTTGDLRRDPGTLRCLHAFHSGDAPDDPGLIWLPTEAN